MLVATKDQIEAAERQMNVQLPRELSTALADCGDAFTLPRYVIPENALRPEAEDAVVELAAQR